MNIKDRLQTAIRYHNAGNLEEATKIYQQILDHHPNEINSLHLLGVAAASTGEFHSATEFLRKAIELKPDFIEANMALGEVFGQTGKFDEAISAFHKVLSINPDLVEANLGLGLALKEKGDTEGAISRLKDVVTANPNFPMPYILLGDLLRVSGAHDDATTNFKKALTLAPGSVEAHFGMGLALSDKGDLESAAESLLKAVKADPNHAMAHYNLGVVLRKKGDLGGSVRHFRDALHLDPDNKFIVAKLASSLHNLRFGHYDNRLKADLEKCLSLDDINYRSLSPATASVLKLDPKFKSLLNNTLAINGSLTEGFFSPQNIATLSDPLFLQLLEKSNVPDFDIENFLIKIRSSLLTLAINKEGGKFLFSSNLTSFIYALAKQCFFNEYIYLESDQESYEVRKLEELVSILPSPLSNADKLLVAILASFRLIYKLDTAEAIATFNYKETDYAFYELIKNQIINPLYELKIRADIPSLIKKKDDITEAVQAQYEENPFPRWEHMHKRSPRLFNEELKGLFPHIAISNQINCESPEILIAGCGTGLQAIDCHNTYRNAKITAIDLSLSSLSYAIRKSQELGITNIEFLHANILELEILDKKFDMIECYGVLHHLSDPLKGWKVLKSLLKENGYLMLGLYSEVARKGVVAARDFIAKNSYSSSLKDIRLCRQELSKIRHNQHINDITRPVSAFWTVSELRDLIFHEMEYRYELTEIADTINLLDFEFVGFQHHDMSASSKYLKTFPEDKNALSLSNWHLFELDNPHTFNNCYRFWLKT